MSFVPCLSCQNSSTASSFVAAFLYCSILLLKRLLIRAVAHCWRCSTGFRPLWKEFCPIWRSRHVRGNMATLTLMITVSSEKAGDCRLYGLTTVDVLLGDHARHWDRVADSDNQNRVDRSPNKWQSHMRNLVVKHTAGHLYHTRDCFVQQVGTAVSGLSN